MMRDALAHAAKCPQPGEAARESPPAVDGLGHTSVPGVYAAGDAAVAPQQVAIAMGSGHTAGLVAVRELLLGRPKTSTKTTDNV